MALAAALGRAAAPLLRLRTLPVASAAVSALSRRLVLSGLSTASAADELSPPPAPSPPQPPPPPASKLADSLGIELGHGQWKDQEAEILRDIEPVMLFTKDILHSSRYRDGECLSARDEKVVVEKLLAYHPHSEDKIDCGLDAIMVDWHS